jgi:hypothetical protein
MPTMAPVVVRLVRQHGTRGVLSVARWLLGRGRELWQENLSPAERDEFKTLVTRSKGRLKNLTGDEVARLSQLVVKALLGKDGLDIGDLVTIARNLK